MMSSDFRLPPLEGDDVVVRMEKEMLQRWGFLNVSKNQPKNDNNEPCATVPELEPVVVSTTPDVSNDVPNEKSSTTPEVDLNGKDNQNGIPGDINNHCSSITDLESAVGFKPDVIGGVQGDQNSASADDHVVSDLDPAQRKENDLNVNVNSPVTSESCVSEDLNSNCDKNISNVNSGLELDSNLCRRNEDLENNEENVQISNTGEDNINKALNRDQCRSSEQEQVPRDRQQCLSEQAKFHYDQAYTAYSRNEFCECLVLVDDALELDDVGHDVDLWLLRAKVMNSMGDYREALKSAYKVKAGDRPSRLWVEGALALEKLGLLATAENWVARAMLICKADNGGNDVMDILHMMRSRLRIERVFGPLIKDKPIRVSASFKYNRLVTATKNIQKSEVIFEELPEILEQSIKSHRLTACAQCATSLIQPQDIFSKENPPVAELKKAMKKLWLKKPVVDCKSCREVKYCSEECRDMNWESCHRVVCPSCPESTASMLYDVRKSFRDVIAADGSSWQGWWNAEFSPTFLSRIWATIVCRAKRLADLSDKLFYSTSDWLMMESFLEKYFSTKKFQAASESIPKMHELLCTIFKRSKIMRFPITEKEFNKRYSQLASNVITFHDTVNPVALFVEDIKKDKRVWKKAQNQFNPNRLRMAEFHGLFPLACCLNHSCFPNAELVSARVEGRPGVRVRALMDIRQGEEIVISYVDSKLERLERRSLIWKKFKFVCQCLRCLHEGTGPDQCTNCGKTTKNQREHENKAHEDKNTLKSENVDFVESHKSNNGQSSLPGDVDDEKPMIKDSENIENDHSENPSENLENSRQLELRGATANDVTEKINTQANQNVVSLEETAEEATSCHVHEHAQNPKPGIKFSVCSRCKRAWYCSAQCQKKAWVSGHKKICTPR